MNLKQIALGFLLLDFLGLSAFAIYQFGYIGFFEQMTTNVAVLAVFADAVIALGLICLWMGQDARDRGWSPIPYFLLTLTLGSVGPLVYLIRRVGADEVADEPGGVTQLIRS